VAGKVGELLGHVEDLWRPDSAGVRSAWANGVAIIAAHQGRKHRRMNDGDKVGNGRKRGGGGGGLLRRILLKHQGGGVTY